MNEKTLLTTRMIQMEFLYTHLSHYDFLIAGEVVDLNAEKFKEDLHLSLDEFSKKRGWIK